MLTENMNTCPAIRPYITALLIVIIVTLHIQPESKVTSKRTRPSLHSIKYNDTLPPCSYGGSDYSKLDISITNRKTPTSSVHGARQFTDTRLVESDLHYGG
mmetsp:Transcript_33004/g.44710  ORF Transcript_33004/g.44710 Transcript_33004/m.44710 type:complete len:101 (-) Transcript_33004:36-338(-)